MALLLAPKLLPEVRAFLARARVAEPNLDGLHRRAYRVFITKLVEYGIWAKCNVIQNYFTQSAPLALLNLVSANFTASEFLSPVFTPDNGYETGPAQTGCLFTGFMTSMGAGRYSLNSAHIQVYCMNNIAADANIAGAQATGGGGRNLQLVPWRTDDFQGAAINTSGFTHGFGATFSSRAFIAVRESVTQTLVYKRGAHIALMFEFTASELLPTVQVSVIRAQINGVLTNPSPLQIGHFSIGAALTAAEVAYYSACLDEFVLTVRGSLPPLTG